MKACGQRWTCFLALLLACWPVRRKWSRTGITLWICTSEEELAAQVPQSTRSFLLCLAWFASSFASFRELPFTYVLKGGPMDFGYLSFRATFAKLSRTFRKISVPCNATLWWHPKTCLYPIHTFTESCQNLPVTFRNIPYSFSFIAVHEQTRHISHIFTYQLSRLSRSTFAFAIFRKPAFSFRAGTPD